MIEAANFWRMIIFPNGIIILTGLALIFLLAHLNKIKYLPLYFLPLSYLAGETTVILLLQFESFLFGQFWWPLFAFTAILAVFYLVFSFWQLEIRIRLGQKFWLHFLCLLIIIFFTLPNVRLAYFQLLTAWDARSIWFFHGKAFYFDNKIDPSFLTNPAYGPEWAHPDYPPAIALLATFHAHYLGRWHEILNKSFIYFHWLFSLLSLYSIFQAISISPLISLSATIIFQGLFSLNAHWGLADSFWAITFLLGVLLTIKAWLMADQNNLIKINYQAALFLLILAALTKEEGTIASILFFLFSFLILGLNRERWKLKTLLPICFLMIIFTCPWYIFITIHNIHSEPKLSVLGFLRFDLKIIFDRIKTIFILPLEMKLIPLPLLSFLVFSLLASFLYLLFHHARIKLFLPEIFLFSLFFGYGSILFLIYLGTPHPLSWHLWTSFERTVIFLQMISLTLFVFISRQIRMAEKR